MATAVRHFGIVVRDEASIQVRDLLRGTNDRADGARHVGQPARDLRLSFTTSRFGGPYESLSYTCDAAKWRVA